MSYETWHNYGYGICVSDIMEQDVSRLEKLLEAAPEFQKTVHDGLSARGITTPEWDDYMEYDGLYNLGLATFLQEVIKEAEKIELTACDDFEGVPYLLYQPSYPWNLSDIERNLTEKSLTELFQHYAGILTDEVIPVDHQSVANGG